MKHTNLLLMPGHYIIKVCLEMLTLLVENASGVIVSLKDFYHLQIKDKVQRAGTVVELAQIRQILNIYLKLGVGKITLGMEKDLGIILMEIAGQRGIMHSIGNGVEKFLKEINMFARDVTISTQERNSQLTI